MKSSVLDGPPQRHGRAALVAGTVTCALHAGLAGLALAVGARPVSSPETPLISYFIAVEQPARREPAPPEAVPEAPLPQAQPTPIKPSARRSDVASEAPAAASPVGITRAEPRAGQVLTASDEVVDFGEAFVSGRGKSYAGGVTEAGDTSERAAGDIDARAGGVALGTGERVVVDRSRPPALAGGSAWECPFPVEADAAGVDDAVVSLRVDVGPLGNVLSVTVTSDPGDGFAREARRCAKRKRWAPGLDKNGAPVQAAAVVRVRFNR